jgi:hypothetical protein
MIEVSCPDRPVLRALLGAHPGVALLPKPTVHLQWKQGDWRREVVDDPLACELRGLVEIVDNNPLVCADRFAVPGPTATLALVALAPLARAGILVGPPTVSATGAITERPAITALLADLGFVDGLTTESAEEPGQCEVIATIQPASPADLEALFEETYSRSFYVRLVPNAHAAVVGGRAYAACSVLAEAPDRLRISVVSDPEGKCGAAQVVHAMNVMVGFEEDLGIPERLPV